MNWKAFRLVSLYYLLALVIAFGLIVVITMVFGASVTIAIGRILGNLIILKVIWDMLHKEYKEAKEDLEK
ncbi:hypothetical protein KMDAMLD_00094 [Enterococcus phage vB_OCPT_PG11]|nr:hypothetical protein KMDAMLD_00094 [Enterococcus phage vB_OCPT_PG11]